MNMYMYMCEWTCTCTCICYMYKCTDLYKSVCRCTCTCTSIMLYVHVNLYIHVQVCMYMYMYMYMLHVHVYPPIPVYIHIWPYLSVHTYNLYVYPFLTFWHVPPSQKLPSGKGNSVSSLNGLHELLVDFLQHIKHWSSSVNKSISNTIIQHYKTSILLIELVYY